MKNLFCVPLYWRLHKSLGIFCRPVIAGQIHTCNRYTKKRPLENHVHTRCKESVYSCDANIDTFNVVDVLKNRDRLKKMILEIQREFGHEMKTSWVTIGKSLFNMTPLTALTYWFTRTHLNKTPGSNEDKSGSPPPQQPDDPDKDKNGGGLQMMARSLMFFIISFYIYMLLSISETNEAGISHNVSWSEFVNEILAKGEVEELVVQPELETVIIKLCPGAVVKGKQFEGRYVSLKIADPSKFEEKLRKTEADLGIKPGQGVLVSYHRGHSFGKLLWVLLALSAILYFMKKGPNLQLPDGSEMFMPWRKAQFVRADLSAKEAGGINFKDIAGLKSAKIEVMEFVDYLKKPDKIRDLGGRLPRGALLLGPPGCGKTLLARAVANEAQVPFLAMAGSEFVEMLGGLGAARVRDLFKEARQKAPCIVYIDEVDAIGRKRGGSSMVGSGEEEHTLNQLLVEMDGIGTTSEVIMLASTNRPDVLDVALLRPGRFDRHITIDLPTLTERMEIFAMYLSKLKLAPDSDGTSPAEQLSRTLAQLSPGMSGADIANICNEGALYAARHKKKFIDVADFRVAVERVSAGAIKKSNVLNLSEKRIIAYHEAGHAVVGWLLRHTDPLLWVSIVPRTSSVQGFSQYEHSDKHLYSQDELFDKMCLSLGGRAAEALIFNRVTTGAENDLKHVTKMAYDQVRLWGMNDTLGQVSFPTKTDGETMVKPYSKRLAQVMDDEVKSLINKAYRHTEKIVKDNREKLKLIAESLLEKESLAQKDIEALIGPPPFKEQKQSSPL